MNEREADELFALSSSEKSNLNTMREGRATPLEDVGGDFGGTSPLHDGGIEHEDDQDVDPRLQEMARRAAGQPPPKPPRRQPQRQPQEQPEGEEGEGEGEEGEDDDGRQKTVPHGALHQERRRRQQAEDRARDFEAKLNLAAMRLQALLEAQQHFAQQPQQGRIPVQPVQPPPSWRQRPIEAGEAMEQRLARLEQERQEEARQRAWETEQQRQAQYQEQVWEAIYSDAMQDWQSYKQERPEALGAYQYLLSSREQELLASRLTPQQVEQQLAFEESNAVIRARQTGMRLGDYVVAMAQARGWHPGLANGNGEAPSAAERVERTQTAQARGKSMGSARGTTSATAKMTLERLLNMSDGEFARFKDKNPTTFRELLGG